MKIDIKNEWIKLNRKIVNWEWYQDIATFKLFIHCLIKANWKDAKFKGIEIKEKIHERRVELIEEYFKTVPNYELNDSNNEKPAQLKAKDQTYERKPQNKQRDQKGFFKVRFSNDIGEQGE